MTIDVELRKGIAVVTLNRPETKNAITQEMRRQLWEAFEDIALDNSVRAAILTGAGGNFCSGMDVGNLGQGGVNGSLDRMHTLHRIARSIYHLKKPTIAAIPGICVGVGWAYALCCDFIIVSKRARFAQIFRNIGLAPDGGSVWLLRQQLGTMRAKEIAFSGRMVGAEEAVALGLALEATEENQLLERALELAASFATGPTVALGLAKRQFDLAAASSFDQFLDIEYTMQPIASRTEDHHEGLAAFRDKRPPAFKGA